MRKIFHFLTLFLCLTTASYGLNQAPPLSYPFPIEHYNQTPTDWIPPGSISDVDQRR